MKNRRFIYGIENRARMKVRVQNIEFADLLIVMTRCQLSRWFGVMIIGYRKLVRAKNMRCRKHIVVWGLTSFRKPSAAARYCSPRPQRFSGCRRSFTGESQRFPYSLLLSVISHLRSVISAAQWKWNVIWLYRLLFVALCHYSVVIKCTRVCCFHDFWVIVNLTSPIGKHERQLCNGAQRHCWYCQIIKVLLHFLYIFIIVTCPI